MKEVLRFFKGRKGSIVAKLPNGKIALINRNYSGNQPKAGEKWLCRIDFEKEAFAVVTPIEKVVEVPRGIKIVYKCGHEEIGRTAGFTEVPESQVEHGIYVEETWTEDTLCPECRKFCKHQNTEIKVVAWNFGFRVDRICKDCEKKETIYDFTDDELHEKGFLNFTEKELQEFEEKLRREIREPEILQKALQKFGEIRDWVLEYNGMLNKEKELKKEMVEVLRELGEKMARIDKRAPRAETVVYKDGKYYLAKYVAPLINEELTDSDEVIESFEIEIPREYHTLAKKFVDMSRELEKVKEWLVENRPVE